MLDILPSYNDFEERHNSRVQAPVRARLKWFNGPKGFGFLILEEKDVDAFIHVTTLQNAGINSIGEGACLLCDIDFGPKGAMVNNVLEVIDRGFAPKLIPIHNGSELDDSPRTEMMGTVKWYKQDKGFGFIVPEDGKKDVFIHHTCLERHNLHTLEPGQAIKMTFINVTKGREVVDFELIAAS